MAVINPTYTKLESARHSTGMVVIQWALLTEADTCDPAACGDFADRSVQIQGTFGGSTVVINGSNDGVNYHPLTDPQGNDISRTSADLEAITEMTAYIKPTHSGGTGTSLTITVVGAR